FLSFWLVQSGANRDGGGRIHRGITLLGVLDFFLLVHQDRCPLRPLILAALHVVGLQYLVRRQHFFVHVAEKRKRNSDLLGECGVGGGTVDADSEDDGVACFEFGQISLIGLKFFRSTAGKCQDVEGENDVFLASIIAQLHLLPLVAEEREIGRRVTYLQIRLGDGFFLRCGRNRGDHLPAEAQQQKNAGQCRDNPFHALLLINWNAIAREHY